MSGEPVSDLIDRAVDFADDTLWVTCAECDHRFPQRYSDDAAGSPAPCPNGCEENGDYPPYRATLRDVDDPVLSVHPSAFVWYHTSTHQSWPPPQAWTDAQPRALHIGTYEAAVESMFYRMQMYAGEATAPYFLHRVTIDPQAKVESGLGRDVAAWGTGIVALRDVTAAGVLARRYLNEREHPGSVSVVLSPRALTGVQTVALPVPTTVAAEHPALAPAVRYADDARASIAHAVPEQFADRRYSVLDVMNDEPGAWVHEVRDTMATAAVGWVDEKMRQAYTAGVGERAVDELEAAVRSAPGLSARDRHTRYRDLASLLTAHTHIRALLVAQPSTLIGSPRR